MSERDGNHFSAVNISSENGTTEFVVSKGLATQRAVPRLSGWRSRYVTYVQLDTWPDSTHSNERVTALCGQTIFTS